MRQPLDLWPQVRVATLLLKQGKSKTALLEAGYPREVVRLAVEHWRFS